MNLNSKLIKLVNVAGVAAIGHLLSVVLIPYVTKNFGSDIAANVALIDSTFLLISSILAFGLSLSVTRDVALVENWREKVSDCLSARLILSLFIQLVALFFFFFDFIGSVVFFCFLCAPIVALNLDFVLYGRDKAVSAAYVSFVRIAAPIVALMLTSHFFHYQLNYFFLIVLCLLISSFLVFAFLDFFPKEIPRLPNILLYKPVVLIGLGTVAISFQRLGFVSFLDIDDSAIVYVSTLLKFYLAFVAVRRLFIQTFYLSLRQGDFYVKIELFCFLVALLIAFICFAFTDDISVILFGKHAADGVSYIFCFGFVILSGSLFATADARLFLEGKDKEYYSSAFFSICVWFVSIVYVYAEKKPLYSILICLGIAELCLALFYRYFLVRK